jgi:phage protein D
MPVDTASLSAPDGRIATIPGISIGGQANSDLTAELIAIRIEEDVDGLYRCDATFGNWGLVGNNLSFLFFDRQTLDFGASFAVQLGSNSLFAGKIGALEAGFPEGAPPVITVLAEDGLEELRKTRRTRAFADVTDAAVFNTIASDHGLTADVQVTGPTYRVLTQLAQSDLAFARERARAIDAELWLTGQTMTVRPRASRNTDTATLSYGRELRTMTVAADLAGQRTDVTVGGWDVAAKAAISELTDDSALGNELQGNLSGASILGSALSPRHEYVAHAVPLTTAEARARSQALFLQAARRFVRGHIVAETSSKLQVGAHITIDGLGDLFSGEYYVSQAVHRFDRADGLRTELTVERPGLGQVSS